MQHTGKFIGFDAIYLATWQKNLCTSTYNFIFAMQVTRKWVLVYIRRAFLISIFSLENKFSYNILLSWIF